MQAEEIQVIKRYSCIIVYDVYYITDNHIMQKHSMIFTESEYIR